MIPLVGQEKQEKNGKFEYLPQCKTPRNPGYTLAARMGKPWGEHREMGMGDCNVPAVLIPFQSQGQDV